MNQDPRLGLPSASSALENSLCPGRFRKQQEWALGQDLVEMDYQGLPSDSGDEIDSDAEAGKRVHLLYAGEECPAATEAERLRAEKAHEVDRKKKAEWLSFFMHEDARPVVEIRERRWWLTDSMGLPIYSGQSDVVWIRGNQGQETDILVGDLKALWGDHDPAALNMQIRHYIALVDEAIRRGELPYSNLRSAAAYLNQPAKTLDPRMVMFDQEDLTRAVVAMNAEVIAIHDPNSPRRPGPAQCKRCLAKLVCEEYLASAEAVAVIKRAENPVPAKKEVENRIKALPADKLVALLPWLKALADMHDIAVSEAKRRLRADPDSVPGYCLHKNPTRSKITDPKMVFDRLSTEFGVSADEFCAASTISATAVEDLIRAKMPSLKGMALAQKVKDLKEGATTPIPVADSLAKG